MKENSEIQLIAVREEIKRRCPSYTLPILPDFMDCPILSKELAPKKERQKKVEKTKTAVEPDDASEEEELLPYNDNDSFFTTLDGTVTPRNSAYEDALDNTQEDEDEPEKGPNKVEEEEDVLELVFPDEFPGEASDQAPNDGTPLPLKATVVDLNLDLPTEINSEREVEAPVLYFPHFDVNITQSDCDLTQEDDCHLDES
ncbi:hypothetical protein L596_018898 [Steinernema carpocapsae]|uniref:Uncharacterized protein n=1 Tax=Steinernema carpocapsae TaxID=34508 RepID=A0A4U5N6H4_STECR|nr:hypothetical protein L596_018898 [Steinernema carpocapsae]